MDHGIKTESIEHTEESKNYHLHPKKPPNGIVLIPHPSDDSRDPLNWPLQKKILKLGILGYGAMILLCQSLANQAGLPPQAELYHVAYIKVTYPITAGLAGSVVSPFIFAPVSQYVGRSSVMFWTSIITMVCNIWSASMTKSTQYIAFLLSRMFAGFFSTAPITLGAGMILDMFYLHQRGKAFAAYGITGLFGAMLAPVTSGFITQNTSWTVQFWWVVGAVGLYAILVFLFFEDTTWDRENPSRNHPAESHLASRITTFFPGHHAVNKRSKSLSFLTMCRILFCPQVFMCALATTMTFSWVVGINTTLAVFLQTPVQAGGYGFSPSQNAEFVFAQWVAFVLAEVVGYCFNDRVALWMARRRGGVWKPEYRMFPILVPPAIAIPVGVIIFGISLQYHLHYMVIALGFFLASYGDIAMMPVLNNYLAENYRDYANETFSIMFIARVCLAIGIPFFILPWIAKVGPGWAFGTMAICCTVGLTLVAILAWKGHEIRKYSPQQFVSTEEGEKVVEDSSDINDAA